MYFNKVLLLGDFWFYLSTVIYIYIVIYILFVWNTHFQICFDFDILYVSTSGLAIGTKFAPPNACIYMDEFGQKFLQMQSNKPLIWLRYIDDIFFIWTPGEQELEIFLKHLSSFTPNLSFTNKVSKNSIPLLTLKVKLIDVKLKLICTWNLLIAISTFITYPLILNTLSPLLFIVKLSTPIGYAF